MEGLCLLWENRTRIFYWHTEFQHMWRPLPMITSRAKHFYTFVRLLMGEGTDFSVELPAPSCSRTDGKYRFKGFAYEYNRLADLDRSVIKLTFMNCGFTALWFRRWRFGLVCETCLFRISSGSLATLVEMFHGFYQPLQANSGIVPWLGVDNFVPNYF
jgi:hypothetical protein